MSILAGGAGHDSCADAWLALPLHPFRLLSFDSRHPTAARSVDESARIRRVGDAARPSFPAF